jgi:hypothetical protein
LRPERASTPPAAPRRLATPDLLLGAVLTVALTAIAIAGAGGTQLGTNTWVQCLIIVIAAALGVTAILAGAPGRRWGAGPWLLFALLTGLVYASIAWSVQPATSWLEANRVLSYLAAFGAAIILARLFPRRWPALLGAVAAATTAVSAWALLLKIFPGALDRVDQLGRLSQPLDYWNAVGLMAAMGIPAFLWAAARHGAPRWAKSAAAPAIAILVSTLVLSYSRGALIVAALGAAVWFALVPLRLRGALILAIGGLGGVAVSAWALPNHSITADYVPLAQRIGAGHSLGVVLLVVLIACAAAGWLVSSPMERVVLAPAVRRRLGIALLCLVGLLPAGGIAALATSSRGLDGEVSHFWRTITNPNGGTGDQPDRLVKLSNSRPHYWSVGLKVGAHHPLAGAGELGYATAYTRYSTDRWPVRHAHSYVIQTFADLGVIGTLVSLALLVAWGFAAARPLRPAGRAADAERLGMLTLLSVVTVFGLHSLIDWTWFIPGTAIIALVCAGWLAGRGPVLEPVGVAAERKRLSLRPTLGLATVALTALTVGAVWGIFQPLRSSDADSAAVSALVQGHAGAAITDARRAAAADPVSVEPLFILSEIYGAENDPARAREELVKATSLQPENPQTWSQLGAYDLAQHQPARALPELRRAHLLDLGSSQISSQLQQAEAEAAAEASH